MQGLLHACCLQQYSASGIAFKGHTDYVGAVGSIWSNAITAVIVAQTEHQLDTDLYYGRKEYSDDLNDGEQDRGYAEHDSIV